MCQWLAADRSADQAVEQGIDPSVELEEGEAGGCDSAAVDMSMPRDST